MEVRQNARAAAEGQLELAIASALDSLEHAAWAMDVKQAEADDGFAFHPAASFDFALKQVLYKITM